MRIQPTPIHAISPLLLLLAVPMLAGCNVRETPTAEQDEPVAAPDTVGVVRETAEPAAPAVERVTPKVIASQPGPDGTQLDLITLKVTGDLLTVTMRCSSDQRINSESIDVSKIVVIDDATAQQYSVLRDDSGNWLASDVNRNHSSVSCGTRPGVLWAKFPAPPATSQTVSITLPDVAPFDGMTVMR